MKTPIETRLYTENLALRKKVAELTEKSNTRKEMLVGLVDGLHQMRSHLTFKDRVTLAQLKEMLPDL